MFNPNSAFPRQTTYVPWTGGRGIQAAVNIPNFGPGSATGSPRLPSLYGNYAANAQRQARVAAGSSGVREGVAAFAARKQYADSIMTGGQEQGEKFAQRRLTGQGYPATPEVDRISKMGQRVVGDSGIGPIAVQPASHVPSERVGMQSHFGSPVSQATVAAVNESLTRSMPMLGRTLKT